MRSATLREHEKLKISSDISLRDASALQDVTNKGLHRYRGHLVAENHVGVITSRQGFVLEIIPKIELGEDSDQDNNFEKTKQVFLKMLRCYRGLKGNLPTNESSIRSMSRFPMLDIFVHLFLTDLQKLVRSGLAHRYIPVEENLPYLRGRLLFREHLRQNLVNASRLFVAHETFSVNRPANRLIRSTLNRLGKRIRGEENQMLHQLDVAFADVPESINIRSDWDAHHIDRSMPLYRPVMQWIRLFLFDEGLTAYSGKHKNLSLLFPMEEVFEDFVTHAFRRHQKKYEVKAQGPEKDMAVEGQKVYKMKPDIVLMKDNNIRFVLDAKWKKLDGKGVDSKHQIAQSDLYQIYAYSKCYECKTVMLVYPQNQHFKDPLQVHFFDETSLICIPFDCTQPKESVKRAVEWLSSERST